MERKRLAKIGISIIALMVALTFIVQGADAEEGDAVEYSGGTENALGDVYSGNPDSTNYLSQGLQPDFTTYQLDGSEPYSLYFKSANNPDLFDILTRSSPNIEGESSEFVGRLLYGSTEEQNKEMITRPVPDVEVDSSEFLGRLLYGPNVEEAPGFIHLQEGKVGKAEPEAEMGARTGVQPLDKSEEAAVLMEELNKGYRENSVNFENKEQK